MMTGTRGVHRTIRAQGMGRLMFVLFSGAIIIAAVPGCLGHGLFASGYDIRGEVQDFTTGEALVGVRVEIVVEAGDMAFDPGPFSTDSTGAINLSMFTDTVSAHFLWPGIPVSDARPTPAPVPDRVTLLIGRGDEQVEVVIELTEEMIGELTEFGDRTIELGTILVPGGDA